MPGLFAPDRAEAGRVLGGRYRLVELIARGGMAEVWEAYDEVLARPVAAKVLQPELASDGVFLERFRREAVLAARLAHFGVVSTFDTGVDRGIAYIVMELVQGRTLRAEIDAHGRLEPWTAVSIARQVADALVHAHRAGLIHRDIKPANLLLTDDDMGMPRVKITDFGIAKASAGLEGNLTRTGTVMGTPKYVSPEQIRGGEPDARADLYSVGVVLFEMLTGAPPFVGETDMATALAHLHDRVPRVAERVRVPADLDRLVGDLLAKDPAGRVPSALDLRNRLDALDLTAARPSPQRRGWAGRREGDHRPQGRPDGGRSPAGGGDRTGSGSVGPGWPRGNGASHGDETLRGNARGRVGPGSSGAALAGPPEAGPVLAGPAPPRPGPPAAAIATPGRTERARPTGGARSGSWPPRGDTGTATRVEVPDASGGRAGGPGGVRGRPGRSRVPGLLALVLVVVAALVATVIVLTNRTGSGSSSASGRPIPIAGVSVYLPVLGHTLDDAAQAGLAVDGNPSTAWHTDRYDTPAFGNLYPGIGLAVHLSRSATLHKLTVTSTSVGWSAAAYVSDHPVAVGQPVSAWGAPTTQVSGIDGSATLSLGGRSGSWVLLFLTYLGPARQVAVAELSVT